MAAVHAFPSLQSASQMSSSSLSVQAFDTIADEMQVKCHQSVSAESKSSGVSACEIFCAAMGTALTTEISVSVGPLALSSEVLALPKGFTTRQTSVEPQPPK